MWDFPDAGLEETEAKYTALVAEVKDLCQEFLKKKGEEASRVEAELEQAAKEAEDERMANGEEEDHDYRKLKKADRMRLVMTSYPPG